MTVSTLTETYWGTAVPVNPDYDLIFSALQSQVTNDGNTQNIWTDAITAATGSYIIRMVSSFTADLTFALERAQQEVMLPTARRPSSIYMATTMLGAHIQRKIPSSISVRIARDMTNTTPIYRIPAYTAWNIGNAAFFNRSDIVFFVGIELLTVTLNRGTITSDTATSNGSANQSFVIQQPKFRISDVDLFCTIAGQTWNSTNDGLWEQNATAQVFQETTTVNGNVRIDFGDGVYGAIPPAGTFTVDYVLVQTSDYDASQDLNPPPINTLVTCNATTFVKGLTLGEMSAIIPEKPPSFYKKQAPFIRSGHLRGNNRKNLLALALEYPGVIDARLLGQAEINPRDLRWMTGVSCILLTADTWGDSDWAMFLQYMTQYSDSARHFYRTNAVAVPLNFIINVTLALRANVDTVKQMIQTALQNLLVPTQGSLGNFFNRESIGAYLKSVIKDSSGQLIINISILEPYDDVVLTPMQYATYGSANINPTLDPRNFPKVVSGVVVPTGLIGLSSNAGGQ